MNLSRTANPRAPLCYGAHLDPTLPSPQLEVHSYETSQPILQDGHFVHARYPEPFNNADVIPTSVPWDPRGSVQTVTEHFINNQSESSWVPNWQEPLPYPTFDNQPPPLNPEPKPNLLHPIGSLPQAPTYTSFDPPAAYAHSYAAVSTNNCATSSTGNGHVQLGDGQSTLTTRDHTTYSGPVIPFELPPATPPFLSYIDPAVSHPRPTVLDAPVQGSVVNEQDMRNWSYIADSGWTYPPMRPPPVCIPGIPYRRPHPFVRIDDPIQWVRPDLLKMTLSFDWSLDAGAGEHECWS
ncbi:hypothetical protein BGW80DRAFT_1272291 [Lactifluus volemus]|nr:hypothetical protein BGW80DRAFT_1272291 [Lactifluus volemus]